MGGTSPEAWPPGGARVGLRGRKGQALTLLPTHLPPVLSPPSWAPGWTRARRTSVSPPTSPASGNWWPTCRSTYPAPTWSAVPTSSWPSWSTRTSARQSQRGRQAGGHGEQRLASDCPCGHHRRGPQSGTSGIGGGMFPIWKAGSGTSCSLTTSQDVEPPPAAAPTTRRPQSAAEAAADEAAPSQRHPISVWRDRQAGAPRAAPRRRLLPRRR